MMDEASRQWYFLVFVGIQTETLKDELQTKNFLERLQTKTATVSCLCVYLQIASIFI